MSLYSVARNLAVLGVNVVEAVVYSVFDFDRQADELWDWRTTSSAAGPSPEAADEQPPRSVSNQDVERGGLQTLSVRDLRKAANYAYLCGNEDGLWRRLAAYADYLETTGVYTP